MLALNFDGGTFWDAVMRFASGIPNWIPLYVIVLFIIYCKGGWKYMLFLLIAVGLGVGICDQICNFFKANVDYLRPVHVKELVSDLHVLTGPRINLNGTVSGHASTSFCVFLLTALAMRKGWFTAIMLLYTLLTSYSRIYISAHFPFQILFGWILGTVVFLAAQPPFRLGEDTGLGDPDLLPERRRAERTLTGAGHDNRLWAVGRGIGSVRRPAAGKIAELALSLSYGT